MTPPLKPNNQQSSGFLSDTQAQTLNDFAIGVSLFLLTVGFVFAFIPNLLAPFGITENAGEPIRVDRTSNYLLEQTLTTNSSGVVLDNACTTAFFANTTTADCPGYSPQSIQALTGNSDTYALNVRITDSQGTVVVYDGVPLNRGADIEQNSNGVVSTRMVILDGEIYRFSVALW